jgi:NAD(P)-dependent dehydrogenase (short-subunit alcohol dehydrogenase family)
MTSNPKVAVVTGTSSGIGREISLTLARNGFLTYATMRNLSKKENVKSVAEKENLPVKIVMLDVTDDRSVKDAIKSITAEADRIDVLVNNAGYGLVGAFEDLAMEEIKSQYKTIWCYKSNSSSPPHYEKTEVWDHCKHQFSSGKIWFSWIVCLCWHEICC